MLSNKKQSGRKVQNSTHFLNL